MSILCVCARSAQSRPFSIIIRHLDRSIVCPDIIPMYVVILSSDIKKKHIKLPENVMKTNIFLKRSYFQPPGQIVALYSLHNVIMKGFSVRPQGFPFVF